MTTKSKLKSSLEKNRFVITAETSPPDAADPETVLNRVNCLKDIVDAVNVTDGAGAKPHMSALATAAILAKNGIEPVLQFTTRDRNRLALQGDLIGGWALGIPNILCLYGDDITVGDQPDSKKVHDIDSRQLMETAKIMKEKGTFPTGRKIDPRPELFIGAADLPRIPDQDFNASGLLAKISAGANFFQTQFAFDIEILKQYMKAIRDAGVTEKAYYIVGLGPLSSAKSAKWMDENLFGVNIPEKVIKRIEGADDQKAEGQKICIELLEQFKEIDGIHGAHLMGPRQEQTIADLVSKAGLGV
jgi:5,10-methylenetetrahydrofolate reductase